MTDTDAKTSVLTLLWTCVVLLLYFGDFHRNGKGLVLILGAFALTLVLIVAGHKSTSPSP